MIIEVRIEGEQEARRYRVVRDRDGVRVARLRGGDEGEQVEEAVALDWRAPEPRVYSLLIGERSYDVHVDEQEGDPEMLLLHLLSGRVHARATDARKRRVVRPDAGPDGVVRLTAPIPGRVVKVLARAGTAVQRGDGIIVLEAMKMENELRAPRDGTVTEVAVQEGQGVDGGALLATIE